MLHDYCSRGSRACISKFMEGKSSFLVIAGWHIVITVKAVTVFLLRFAMYRTERQQNVLL